MGKNKDISHALWAIVYAICLLTGVILGGLVGGGFR